MTRGAARDQADAILERHGLGGRALTTDSLTKLLRDDIANVLYDAVQHANRAQLLLQDWLNLDKAEDRVSAYVRIKADTAQALKVK